MKDEERLELTCRHNSQDVALNGSGDEAFGVSLTLSEVNLFTTGLYGCEASAEKSFHTEIARKQLTVIGRKK